MNPTKTNAKAVSDDVAAWRSAAAQLDESLAESSQWVVEATELRKRCVLPSGEGLPELVAALRDVRTALDRLEGIYISSVVLRDNFERIQNSLDFQAQHRWDSSLIESKSRSRMPLQSDGAFVPPRERYAQASLATFEWQRLANSVATSVLAAKNLSYSLKIMLDGARDVRSDLLRLASLAQMSSHLEQ